MSTYASAHPISEVKRWDRKKKEFIKISCPSVMLQYNKSMGGVNLLDSLIASYRSKIKSKKWYHRLVHHFIDMTVVQSWLLYRRDSNGMSVDKKNQQSLLQFKTEIAYSLCKSNITCRKRGRSSFDVDLQNEQLAHPWSSLEVWICFSY